MNHTRATIVRSSPRRRTLFSRDINYLRDLALFWPFVFYSIFAVGSAFSHGDRNLAVRFGAATLIVLVLAKERIFLLLVAVGFIAIQCAIALFLHPWDWAVFGAGILSAGALAVGNHYWRNRKLAYDFPKEFKLIDALWSVASMSAGIACLYVIIRV